MKTTTKHKPLALLGERRFMATTMPPDGGSDWRFDHSEFKTFADAQREAKRQNKLDPTENWFVVEFYFPDGELGTFAMDGMLRVPLRIRIAGGAA